MAWIGRQLPVGAIVVAVLLLLPGTAFAAGALDAVTTPGSGTLTMCRDWLVYDSCTPYHNVTLPEQIAIGDQVKVVFGSNAKEYDFHVTGIRRDGDGCTVFSDHSGAAASGEKIEVTPCRPAAPPRQ